MSLFTIDKAKCKGDGKCARVCPVQIIGMDEKARIPYPLEAAEELCINCGHCMAVCPPGALVLKTMSPQDCLALKAGWKLNPEQVEFLFKGRRSIRNYKEQLVDRPVIEKIIDIARYAPSGINRQPVYWEVISGKENILQLSEAVISWMQEMVDNKSPLAAMLHFENIISAQDKGADRICRGAPHIVLAYSVKEEVTGAQACTIALTYFELAALSFGLGACWAGYVSMAVNLSEKARKLVELSSRATCHGAMMLGFAKYDYQRVPLRNSPNIRWR
ncbi:MAG: nitroreductase family protein [Candidatus Omnitrophota bacterium]|jgi:nitroreductase/NAD-dependent dihydropyrimidine dehydrogenase PreA subunit